MNIFAMTIVASLLMAIAGYAQVQLPHYTAAPAATRFTRLLLVTVGAALGCIAAAGFFDHPPLAALAFLTGFGAAHFPAAFILFVKHERGAGKS
jgi:hypothetical protein